MKERLYINGKHVDLNDDTRIVFNIKGNFFQDIGKIIVSNTNSFRIPITANNRRVFAFTGQPSAQSTFPYMYHSVSLYRDGMEVIKGGQLYVLSISNNEYQVSIIFTINEAFNYIKSTDDTLQDLDGDERIIYDPRGGEIQRWSNWTASYYYAVGDYSKALEGQNEHAIEVQNDWLCKWRRPIVRVEWILGKIREKYGFYPTMENDTFNFIYRLAIPLLTQKADRSTQQCATISIVEGKKYRKEATLNVSDPYGIFSSESSGQATKLNVIGDVDMTIDVNIRVAYKREDVQTVVVMLNKFTPYICHYDTSNTEVAKEGLLFTYEYISDDLAVVKSNAKYSFSMSDGDYLSLCCNATGFSNIIFAYIAGGEMYGRISQEDAVIGEYMPIIKNLPKVKIIDFFKTLLTLTGTYLSNNFFEINIYNKTINEAHSFYKFDLSDKLIGTITANDIEFKVGDYAQKNNYKYKKADLDGEQDGILYVTNKTLEKEKDIVTLPFAASASSGVGNKKMAHIPIYQLDNFDDMKSGEATIPSYSQDATEYRIVYIGKTTLTQPSGDYVKITFPETMNLQNIINEKYNGLKQILDNAFVVKADFLFTQLEVQEFDFNRHFYLRQYGCYFLCLELRQKDDKTCTLTLVKI